MEKLVIHSHPFLQVWQYWFTEMKWGNETSLQLCKHCVKRRRAIQPSLGYRKMFCFSKCRGLQKFMGKVYSVKIGCFQKWLGIFTLGVHRQAYRDQGWDNCVKFSVINTIQNSFSGFLFWFNDYSQTGGESQVNSD